MQAFSIHLYMNTILIYSKKSTRIQNIWNFYLYIAAIPKLCVARFYKREVYFMEACQSLHLNQLSTNQSSASKYWMHARKCYRDPCRLSFTQRACSQANRFCTIVILKYLRISKRWIRTLKKTWIFWLKCIHNDSKC
jgi:hypothetical protein